MHSSNVLGLSIIDQCHNQGDYTNREFPVHFAPWSLLDGFGGLCFAGLLFALANVK